MSLLSVTILKRCQLIQNCIFAIAEAAKYRARLCVMKSWKDGKGYGFSMQAQKGKTGHFIGHLDDDSPAQLAGLVDGDRIIEVNGVNVEDVTHKEVPIKKTYFISSQKLIIYYK